MPKITEIRKISMENEKNIFKKTKTKSSKERRKPWKTETNRINTI